MIALNYGRHYDMLEATKSIASKVKDGLLQLEDIDNKLFEQELSTKCANFAKPAHKNWRRTENQQLAYSELYFTKTLFPDFGEEELKEAILSFQLRHRRFGGHTY
ncbi:(2z,6z)-farnesyl diphosphate synthase, chloroplastic [Nicotiana attenuata]|uniref:(2z,6z)-farnesyl diphosphate synthase, chloroplastic n=1 Tax=Nicotiana attenuata TaxID=49451 RepID=A0A1J6L952_NICAT|nr:(2z,6z)-farnesyl diphosphate synthase, chloroplastic [Nicotiana attenuata]